MRNRYWEKGLVFGIIILLVGAIIITGVDSDINEINCLQVSNKVGNLNLITLTFSPTDDAYVRKDQPEYPGGPVTRMIIRNEYGDGGDNSSFECLGFIKFNISSLPSDAIIVSAMLNLYYFLWVDNDPVGRDLNLYRLTSNWDEDTISYNNQPAYASYPTKNSTVLDHYDWMSWNVIDDIQGFLNESFDDYGWRIIDENYWGMINIPTTVFYTKEYGDYIPYLEIKAVSSDYVYVDDDFDENTSGWGYDHFDKIQDGVDAVNESGTVYVLNGTYYENIIVSKTIDLIGENRDYTIIDCGGSGNVVNVSVDWVNISGFTIQNSSSMMNPYHGIVINSNYTTVMNNTIINNGGGIRVTNSQKNTIIDNNISWGGYYGIYLGNSSDNIIKRNSFYNSGEEGILIGYSSCNNTITDNDFLENGLGVRLFMSSDNNIVYHNNFINNYYYNANDECNNTWDDGYPSGGNYWSDYLYDDDYNGPNQDNPGRDGVGDVPYEIPCEHGTDYYPLIKPYGWIYSPPNIPDKPSGETIILPGMSYTYNTSTIDPDNDSIWYNWSWGDGTFSDWIGPYDSGEVISSTHIYAQGTYEIKVKAKDSRNPETDWSDPLKVNAIFPNLETVLLFGFIKNLTKSTDYYSFNSEKVLWIGFNPIFPEIYSSNELIIVSDKYFGILLNWFIFGFFNAMVLT